MAIVIFTIKLGFKAKIFKPLHCKHPNLIALVGRSCWSEVKL